MGRDFHPSQRPSFAGEPHGEDVVRHYQGGCTAGQRKIFPPKRKNINNHNIWAFYFTVTTTGRKNQEKRKNQSNGTKKR